jgi:hypothetical protein
MQTIYSTLRLAVGCWGLLGGIVLTTDPDTQSKVLGTFIGGTGLAVALHETAYVYARFMKAKD